MKVLVYAPNEYRSYIRVGTQHYADQMLSDGHSLFWLREPLHPLNLLKGLIGPGEHRDLIGPWRRGGELVRERLITYHPITVLPYRNSPVLCSRAVLNSTLNLTIPRMRQRLCAYGFDAPDVLWLAQTLTASAMASQVRYRKLIYRMSDHAQGFSHIPASSLRAEEELARRADVVIATSRPIVERARLLAGDRAVYLPNGVDYDHFAHCGLPEPTDLARIPRPRAVYVGTIHNWFDIELMREAAKKLSSVCFLLIGPAWIDLQPLCSLPNVRALGHRKYQEIPAYLRHCDVAVVPFRKTELTQATSAVKLYEYFAAGLPVVSVDLEEIRNSDSPALLASDPDSFCRAICASLQTGRDQPQFEAFARENTWARRYAMVRKML